MNAFRQWIMVIGLAVLIQANAGALAAAERVLSGELVIVAGDRFRVVGHDGTFTAPAGTPLEALDGKAVEVTLTDGRVSQIIERRIAITPVVSGFETVRGLLVAQEGATRTFLFAGDSRAYVAPAGIDLTPYGGKWVEATLDADGRVTALTLVAGPLPASPRACALGGTTVASGSGVCRDGTTYRCSDGAWLNTGIPCR